MAAAVIDTHGRLDVMVNNAGIVGVNGRITETPTDAWDHTVAVLMRSVFLGMNTPLARMVPQRSGVIISIASTAGILGGLGPHCYTACKHAVIGLTNSVASELAGNGIRVNAIAPGSTVSAMTSAVLTDHHTDTDAPPRRSLPGRRSASQAGPKTSPTPRSTSPATKRGSSPATPSSSTPAKPPSAAIAASTNSQRPSFTKPGGGPDPSIKHTPKECAVGGRHDADRLPARARSAYRLGGLLVRESGDCHRMFDAMARRGALQRRFATYSV